MRIVKTRYLDEEQERTVFTGRSVLIVRDCLEDRLCRSYSLNSTFTSNTG